MPKEPPKEVPKEYEIPAYLGRQASSLYTSLSTRHLDDAATIGELRRIKVGRKTLFAVKELDRYMASKVQHLNAKD